MNDRTTNTDGTLREVETMKDRSGNLLRCGDAVVAESKDGFICEGNVEMLLPWGAKWVDKKWTRGTVVIKNHEDGYYSNWNPDNCEKI